MLMFSVYLKQSNHSIFFSFLEIAFRLQSYHQHCKKYNEIIFANNDVFQISEQIFLFINFEKKMSLSFQLLLIINNKDFFFFFRFYLQLNLQFRSQIMHCEQEAIIPLCMFEWVAPLRSTIKSVSPSHIKLHC